MISFTIPVRTVSEANSRDHWAKKANRAKSLRTAGRVYASNHFSKMRLGDAIKSASKITVSLCRVGKRRLDSDNLAGSLKAVRDGIADALGIDDGSERIVWKYWQLMGNYEVDVVIEVERERG